MKAWIDGKVINGEDARVPVLDHGYLYGDGVLLKGFASPNAGSFGSLITSPVSIYLLEPSV